MFDFRIPIFDIRFRMPAAKGANGDPARHSAIGDRQTAIGNRKSAIGNRKSKMSLCR